MTILTNDVLHGARFKVIAESNGALVAAHHTLQEAQAHADRAHASDPASHYGVVEIKWCGGSKRLSDIRSVRSIFAD